MGLDVYLHKCADRAAAAEREARVDAVADGIRNQIDWRTATDDEKQRVRDEIQRIYAEHDCDTCGRPNEDQSIEIGSARYPDHLFKIGYFRSSYNNGGVNSVLRALGMPDLYDMFDASNGAYAAPDWAAARGRVTDVIAGIDAVIADPLGRFVTHEIPISQEPFDSESSALDAFKERYRQWQDSPHRGHFDSFTSHNGTFFMSGVPIYGIVRAEDMYGGRLYLITDGTHEGEHYLTWHRKALAIVLETIDYVLGQPDTDDYYLIWSG